MSNIYESDVISRLKNSVSKIRGYSIQQSQDIQEAKRIINEQFLAIFYDNLDIFIKKTLPEKLESNNYTITRSMRYTNKMHIEGNKFSYIVPKIFGPNFLVNLIDIFRTDIKFKNIYEQLFFDTQIKLEFCHEILSDGLEMKFIAKFN